MIPLIAAILVLSGSILISRQFLLMKEWHLWACMLVETFMRGELSSRKIEVLKRAGRNRFPITTKMIPMCIYRRLLSNVKKDLEDSNNSMKNYDRLVQGIAFYNKDYTVLLRLVDDVGKREKA